MYGPEFADDLAEFYRRTRSERGSVTPVLLVGDVPAWLVLSYRELLHVCRNPQVFSRNSAHWNLWPQVPQDWPLSVPLMPLPGVLNTEGDEHRRRAGALSDVMEDVDRVDLARMCERTADQLIDSFAGDGKADLIAQYTQQMTPAVIARLVGFPEDLIPALNADLILLATSVADAVTSGMRVMETIGAFVTGQRKEPGPGLVGKLMRHPAGLTDEELTLDVSIIFGTGPQLTANWIGSALRLMLIDDEFSLSLQGGRSSVDQALNEVLWHDPPAHSMIGRWPLEDVTLGGHRIPKGDFIVVSMAAANADARLRLEAGASVNRAHVSFGHGEHSCPVGAPEVAEVIATTAVEVLLDRLPDIHLAVGPDDLRWNESTWLRSLESLPVTFAPVAAYR